MTESNDDRDSAHEHAEQTELVGRREAVQRFAKYTAPVMLAVLMSTTDGKAQCVSSNCNPVSDVRLKRDIIPVGEASGLGLYRYRYLWSDTAYVGVMAQEVAAVMPEAVQRGADGYLRVNYSRLGLRLQTWDEWVAAQ
jgi:hypothetical protein